MKTRKNAKKKHRGLFPSWYTLRVHRKYLNSLKIQVAELVGIKTLAKFDKEYEEAFVTVYKLLTEPNAVEDTDIAEERVQTILKAIRALNFNSEGE